SNDRTIRIRIIMRVCSFILSSRRRHTRCLSDWSSDVCSSDLKRRGFLMAEQNQDKHLGMDRPIGRRDFLNGVAIAAGSSLAGGFLPGLKWLAEDSEQFAQDKPGYYPPALTGMRGSHDGSFETVGAAAHACKSRRVVAGFVLSKLFRVFCQPYDLVIVGGGISGLAAAYFHRKQNPSARILILDNHDDFGGHAKRNEFHVNGHMLLANGGTVSIESPFPYSAEARGLLTELGIEPAKFEEKFDDSKVYKGLKSAYFFDKETFGTDRLVVGGPAPYGKQGTVSWSDFLAKTPLSETVQKDIAHLREVKVDYLPGISSDEKK